MRLQLRARDSETGQAINFEELTDGDWGMYLGAHDGKQVVMLLSVLYNVSGVAEYVTVEDMKHEWCLD